MGVVPREGDLAAANQLVPIAVMPVVRAGAVLPPAVPATVPGAGVARVALLTEILPVVLPVVVQAIGRGAGAAQVAVHPEVLPVFIPAMVLPVAALVPTPRPEVAENASSAAEAQRNSAALTGCPQDRSRQRRALMQTSPSTCSTAPLRTSCAHSRSLNASASLDIW